MKKFVGIALYTAGVVMLTLAYTEYITVASQLSKFMKGSPPDKVILLLVPGGICTIAGLYKILTTWSGKKK